jgi:hypothetical protein
VRREAGVGSAEVKETSENLSMISVKWPEVTFWCEFLQLLLFRLPHSTILVASNTLQVGFSVALLMKCAIPHF